MKNNIKYTVIGLVIGIIIASSSVFALTDAIEKTLHYNNIKITLDGQELIPTDANGTYVEPFIIEGTTYLPVRAVASSLGLDVNWNAETSTVSLTKKTPSSAEGTNVIYNKDGIKISYTGLKVYDEYQAYNLLIENNSESEVFLQGFDVYANGFAMGDIATFGGEIESGKKAAKFIGLRKYMLENSGISQVETIEFTLRIVGESESKVVFRP